MSMYGEGDDYIQDKNNIYDEMKEFLETHPLSELLQIVAHLAECVESENEREK